MSYLEAKNAFSISILSAVTIGAAASKKLNPPPQIFCISADNTSLARGPAAITVIASFGISVTSFSITSISGLFLISFVTIAEKSSLFTAKAPPAGTAHLSAHLIKRESSLRISSLSKPAALSILSAFREFEQMSSQNKSLLCAAVFFVGFISKSLTFMPCLAI